MTKLIIKKEYMRFVEKPAKIVIDNEVVGSITNGKEIVLDVAPGKHTILALGIVDNVPESQYEIIVSDRNDNIVEVKVKKILVKVVIPLGISSLGLFMLLGLLMAMDKLHPALALGGVLVVMVGLYHLITYYSKHMYSIEAVSGVKLTPLSEDKKYR